jgi:hypothetical protein
MEIIFIQSPWICEPVRLLLVCPWTSEAVARLVLVLLVVSVSEAVQRKKRYLKQ